MNELRQEASEGESAGLPLREYWNTLLKRLWTVVLVFVIVLTGVALYTFQQPKIYEATTTIIIDPEPPRVRPLDEANSAPQWIFQDTYFDTQLRVIQSRHVAERVVRDQGLAENLEFLGLTELDDEDALASALEHGDPAGMLLGMLNVEPVPDTRMVKISVQHRSAELAALLSTAVAEAYSQQNSEHRMEALQDAFHWLETQYRSYEAKLNDSTQALTKFKAENPLLFTSPAEQQVLTNAKLEEMNSRLIEVQSRRRHAGYVLSEIRAFKVETLGTSGLTLLTEGLNLTTLSSKYIELKQLEQQQLVTYLDDSAQVVSTREQIRLVESAIKSEIESLRRGFQGSYDALKKAERDQLAEVEATKAEALKLDQLKLLYEQVENQKAEQQRLFELVQRRLNEVSLSKLLESNNIRILDRSVVPTAPVKPRVLFNLLLGVVVGLLAGIGIAFLLEMLDTTIKSQDDIEKQLGLPFLGVVPSVTSGDRRGGVKGPLPAAYQPYLHVHFFPKSAVAECTRTIRTNLLFMAPGKESKVLLVTSPSPLDGKTTTAINLATVMSQSNQRVLIVEADMRRPRLYKAFGLSPEVGLSNVAIGQATLEEAIAETGVPDLHLLPCGPLPPNPSELFHTPAFAQLMTQLRERYDRVIIDSPPVIAVTDALILAQLADGVVVVSKAGVTHLPLLKRTKQLLEGINAPMLGVILNGVNLENRRYGSYYYYYRRYGQYYDDAAS
ncbi:MAG: polysaccharide biosynthesis tyrosine autokinase [Myxococcota bacterium]|jgi:capsular exopolysaccharide synthesis family protein|nr:polysaccharide biosynthesis tyrosine autokinase [Myxococcota bacterium]